MSDQESLEVKIAVLTKRMDTMEKTIERMSGRVEHLCRLADQGRGGIRTLWAVGTVVSILAGVVGAVAASLTLKW